MCYPLELSLLVCVLTYSVFSFLVVVALVAYVCKDIFSVFIVQEFRSYFGVMVFDIRIVDRHNHYIRLGSTEWRKVLR